MSNHLSETADKFELHTRLQLSQLIDSELPMDEARFLLRRLQHNEELANCQERWQLYGDVLRGVALAPAPTDFTLRVQAAVAAEPTPIRTKHRWRWSGGAALVASVAAIILLTVHEWPTMAPPLTETEMVLATTAQLLKPPVSPKIAAISELQHRDVGLTQRSKMTHNQEAAPEHTLATIPATQAPDRLNPFTHYDTIQTKPWPRTVLSAQAPFNANLPDTAVRHAFYPFEPPLPESQPMSSQE
ncbi:sigma-E factor negative regulatory protein [Xylella fastidiosa]|uniref:Sigma-E factor negative regulatory protein n=1 Tax=Xylella fastidiosa TaxID=2371 RepID=A0ABC8AEZ6_XYLFS|nr:sigma-E factor negative regulatory protein [Xylella fastidiosa]ALR06903.1 sigma-E factor negative regulatory protein [Xylella fastidiosa]